MQHEVEFYWLESCQNSERMSDSLINERKVHVETVKALFYQQNPHENVSWKATVYSLDLNYSVHKVNDTRTNSFGKTELKRLMKWEDYSKIHSCKFLQSFSIQGLSIIAEAEC